LKKFSFGVSHQRGEFTRTYQKVFSPCNEADLGKSESFQT
jgi:hypothetical protein